MKVAYRSLFFILSLLILIFLFIIFYKVGKRKGIKKALYRITYRSICVILSFLIAPYLTDFILNFNLYPHELAIQYNGLNFYRLIDFIEEVIVHNEVLNDLYYLFPNLKALLIDFPHVIFIPFAFLIAFMIFSILLMPIYLYMGYRRKRRNLYDVTYKKSGKIWAGILNGVQMIFVISILLTPINGLVRIYSESKQGQIEYDENICQQSIYLEKYEFACMVIEAYDSSVFSLIGKNPMNEYIYDSLTRVEYADNQTNFTNEIVSIAKAGIILNKTGLIVALNNTDEIHDVKDITRLNFKGLTDDDISVIIKAFEQSLYTREVLNDVYELASDYLNYLLKDQLSIDVNIELTYNELVRELEIVLSTINLILNNQSYLDNINRIYSIFEEFSKEPDHIKNNDDQRIVIFFDVVYNLNMEAVRNIYGYLRESKIYNILIPKLFEYLLSDVDVSINVSSKPSELDTLVLLAFDLIDMIKEHKYTYNIMTLVRELSDEEIAKIAKVTSFTFSSETMGEMFYDLLNYALSTINLQFEIPTEVLLEITDWQRELELARLVVGIVDDAVNYDIINYDLILYGLTHYTNTIIFDYAFDWLLDMLPDMVLAWLSGKGFDHLVGKYA